MQLWFNKLFSKKSDCTEKIGSKVYANDEDFLYVTQHLAEHRLLLNFRHELLMSFTNIKKYGIVSCN